MATPTTTDQFLGLLRSSTLVEEKAVETYLASLRAASGLPATPKELARAMVRDGLLSGFQAEQLLQGKSRGFTISGKYLVLEHLGSGGMGSVYLCQHLSMRRRVALKVLPAARAKDPSYLERFYREARAVAAVDHPNIVRAHDIDRDRSLHFLVMEYVDGASLEDIVEKGGPLDVQRACHYIRQAALGLEHAHQAGLVHRDIKPSNILLDRSGVVKVLDLGLARFFNSDDELSKKYDETVLGTSNYLAPEQALNSSDVDIRADIYSLGATFYFLLTGRTLFGAGTAAQKLIWHHMRRPESIRSLRPEVPVPLAELIEERMLAKEPGQRFQTPAEVAAALAPWTATPIPPPAEEEMPTLTPVARRISQERSPSPGPSPASRISWTVSGTAPVMRATPSPASNADTPTAVQVNAPTPGPAGKTAEPSRKTTPRPAGRVAAPPVRTEEDSAPQPAPRTSRLLALAALLLLGAGIATVSAAGLWWAFLSHPATSLGEPPQPLVQAIAREPGTASDAEAAKAAGARAKRVQTPAYEAVVEADGCLTSLKVNGVELLYTGGPIARGAYFYTPATKTLKLPTIAEPSKDIVTAKGDRASIRYEFGSDSMTWTATNLTDEPLSFYMVFSPAVTAVSNNKGEWAKVPAQKNWTTTTWLAGKARLAITGGSRIWGPWGEPRAQVWDGSLKPKETRRFVLKMGTGSEEEVTKAAALTAPRPAANSDLPLQSPLDYQVFQRYARYRGQIALKGKVTPPCDKVEVRITGKSLEGPLPGKWQAVAFDKLNRTLDTVIPTAAGGWYKVEVRALDGDRTVAQTTVDHVGIGEVFVTAGQSNATNCSEEQLSPASGLVAAFDGTRWQPADDPQPGTHDKTSGGSCWPPFGDALASKYQVPIGIASTGHSGSSVRQWQPEGDLFRWMAARVKHLGTGGFRAVLWHQGESDVSLTADEYAQLLGKVIEASRKEAGWDFPWFVAQASYHNPRQPSFPTVREGQRKVWESKAALEGPDTDTLIGDNRDNGGKGIHFSGKGQRAHGKLWADKVAAYLDRVVAE